jgi:hypothetical protein
MAFGPAGPRACSASIRRGSPRTCSAGRQLRRGIPVNRALLRRTGSLRQLQPILEPRRRLTGRCGERRRDRRLRHAPCFCCTPWAVPGDHSGDERASRSRMLLQTRHNALGQGGGRAAVVLPRDPPLLRLPPSGGRSVRDRLGLQFRRLVQCPQRHVRRSCLAIESELPASGLMPERQPGRVSWRIGVFVHRSSHAGRRRLLPAEELRRRDDPLLLPRALEQPAARPDIRER